MVCEMIKHVKEQIVRILKIQIEKYHRDKPRIIGSQCLSNRATPLMKRPTTA